MTDPFKEYKDKYGLVHGAKGSISQNGIRFTAEAVAAMQGRTGDWIDQRLECYSALRLCEPSQNGFLIRHPEKPDDQISIDCFVGWGLASFYLSPLMSMRVLYRLQKCWYFNVNDQKVWWKGFLGRFPQLLAHLHFAAGMKAPLFQRLWWVATVLLSTRAEAKDQDAWALSWALVVVAQDQKGMVQWARQKWINKFKEVHPEGMGKVLGDYFNNPKHPSAIGLRGHFGE